MFHAAIIPIRGHFQKLYRFPDFILAEAAVIAGGNG